MDCIHTALFNIVNIIWINHFTESNHLFRPHSYTDGAHTTSNEGFSVLPTLQRDCTLMELNPWFPCWKMSALTTEPQFPSPVQNYFLSTTCLRVSPLMCVLFFYLCEVCCIFWPIKRAFGIHYSFSCCTEPILNHHPHTDVFSELWQRHTVILLLFIYNSVWLFYFYFFLN